MKAIIAFLLSTFLALAEQVTLGEIIIDAKKRSIILPAKINQIDGIAEFLLVHEQGKVHEAILSTSVQAVELNAALNLLGLRSDQKNKTQLPTLPSLAHLPQLQVFIANKEQAEWNPATDFIAYLGEDNAPEPHPWYYNGSYFYQNNFMAQVEGDLIAIYTNVNALLNLEHPDRTNDTVWIAKAQPLGKKGNPVYLKIVIPAANK